MNYKIFSTEIIYYNKMSDNQKNEFSDKLYLLTCEIFDGGSKEDFEEMVSKCNSDNSKYLIFKNKKNEWVGYIGIHRFIKQIDNKNVVVFRLQIGLKPEYRRKNASFSFAIKEILKYKIFHPTSEVFCFVSIINPSMYSIAFKNVFTIYPSLNKKTPVHIKNIVEQCSSHFGFIQKKGDSFWSRTIGWYPIYSDYENDFWKKSKNKRIKFYMELNPSFRMGKGLLTLVPFTFWGLIFSFFSLLGYSIKKKLKLFIKFK